MVPPEDVGLLRDRSPVLGASSTSRRDRGDGRSLAAGRRPEEPPAPRGEAYPGVAKLFVSSRYPSSGAAALGPDNVLEIWGRGFPPGQDVVMRVREEEAPSSRETKLPELKVAAGKDGLFSTRWRLPDDLPYGLFTIEAVGGAEGQVLASGEFIKSYSDEPERGENPK